MWSNCTLPHCDWTFLDREAEVKSQECGKWQFNSLATKLAATGNARLTVWHIQFIIRLTSTLYNELDWSHADLLVTYFHNLTWQFWKLIFHSVWMFKTTKPPTTLLYKTFCLPTGYPPKQGSHTEPVTVVKNSFLTHFQNLELFYRVKSRSNSFRSKENFNAVLLRGSEDICLIAVVKYVMYHHFFRKICVNYT
jgi:hypothetical protein